MTQLSEALYQERASEASQLQVSAGLHYISRNFKRRRSCSKDERLIETHEVQTTKISQGRKDIVSQATLFQTCRSRYGPRLFRVVLLALSNFEVGRHVSV